MIAKVIANVVVAVVVLPIAVAAVETIADLHLLFRHTSTLIIHNNESQ
jgi:hypothetical protein